MKVEELDRGNCKTARFCGKEAEVKPVSLRTETCYEADGVDELAQHSEVPSSAPEVKREVVRGNNTFLPGEISLREVRRNRSDRGMIPGESSEKSAEAIVVFSKPGALKGPLKRRNRKSRCA